MEVAAPDISAKVVEEPISQVVETQSLASPARAHLTSDHVLPSALQSNVWSAPQIYATGAAQVVAVIIIF